MYYKLGKLLAKKKNVQCRNSKQQIIEITIIYANTK